jgi:hypothetical protein
VTDIWGNDDWDYTSNVYGFTTTAKDAYPARVLDEARDDTNFIIVRDHNTELNKHMVLFFVRKDVLEIAGRFPDLQLGPYTLMEWIGQDLNDIEIDAPTVSSPFIGSITTVDNASQSDKLVHTLQQQIQRVKNALNGRTVKVVVEVF